jgi:hypothetical protein
MSLGCVEEAPLQPSFQFASFFFARMTTDEYTIDPECIASINLGAT